MLLKILISLLYSATTALELYFDESSLLLRQEPNMLLLDPGDNATITCSLNNEKAGKNMTVQNIYFHKRFTKLMIINPSKETVHDQYANRLTHFGKAPHYSIVLKNLTEEDSDFYICYGLVDNLDKIYGEGTLIFVGKQKYNMEISQHALQITPIIIAIAFAFCLVLIFTISVFVIYMKTQKKKNVNQNTYVDMRQTLRRDTMQSTNTYCRS